MDREVPRAPLFRVPRVRGGAALRGGLQRRGGQGQPQGQADLVQHAAGARGLRGRQVRDPAQDAQPAPQHRDPRQGGRHGGSRGQCEADM